MQFLKFPVTPSAAPSTDYEVANKKYVDDSVSSAGGGDMMKATYDPNNKSADAFNADNHVSGTTNKVYTATEQTKLSGIDEGAEVNVNADWNAVSGDAQILNKPTIPSTAADVGAVPTSRTVNSKALSSDITLSAADVSAASSTHTHGNITNDGKIGSTADLPVFTTTAGALTTKTVSNALTALGILDSNSKITPSYASAYIVTVSSSKTLALTDAGTFQKCTNSATITIPLNSSVAFPTGTEIEFCQYGTGTVTFAAGSTTLNTKDSSALKINGQYATACLKKIATDEWLLTGDLTA